MLAPPCDDIEGSIPAAGEAARLSRGDADGDTKGAAIIVDADNVADSSACWAAVLAESNADKGSFKSDGRKRNAPSNKILLESGIPLTIDPLTTAASSFPGKPAAAAAAANSDDDEGDISGAADIAAADAGSSLSALPPPMVPWAAGRWRFNCAIFGNDMMHPMTGHWWTWGNFWCRVKPDFMALR